WQQADLDRILQAVEDLEMFRKQTSFDSLAQMAIRFAYEEAGLSTLIVGARNARQAGDNLRAAAAAFETAPWRQELLQRFSGQDGLGNL
ncbi:MAG TPA: aldo/keto reductase, partial [Oceanipulchritudo sp.]|nr:aldo/keto reductase [Oceanipulchritudo sp.]